MPNYLFILANRIEGLFWIALGGLVLWRQASSRGGWLAVLLMAFDVSDWVEARTGAW